MAYIGLPLSSRLIKIDELTIYRAKEIAFVIQLGSLPFVKLVECRSLETGFEAVVFDVEVELGQKNNVYPIEKHERIAAVFDPQDELMPLVLSLRDNFPKVPHTTLDEDKSPTSLCLYDQLFSEVKLHLTPVRFIERIRQWFADTARGKLHGEDQPLEPLFLEPRKQIVIPFDLFESFNPENPPNLEIHLKEASNNIWTFIAYKADHQEEREKAKFISVVFQCPPQVHGVINRKPKSLLELHEITSAIGFDLLNSLRAVLQKWQSEGSLDGIKDKYLILIIAFPKTRRKDGKIEATDIWTFLSNVQIQTAGIELGVWRMTNGSLGRLLSVDENMRGENIALETCTTMYSFSKAMAAVQNGIVPQDDQKICIIGGGSLGSQVFLNLVRTGFGKWTVVDNDIFLPHNLARHVLDFRAIGLAKAACLAWTANQIVNGEEVANYEIKDILNLSNYSEEMKKALFGADIILDCTASVAAMRFITRDLPSSSRRVALFLTPSGFDSVLLAEDSKREIPLDCLEMQYYRFLINEKVLKGHLAVSKKRIRYANSCRDINFSLSQELVALHSAIDSRAFRLACNNETAQISIWRANASNLSVKCHSFSPIRMTEIKTSGWILYIDELLLSRIFTARDKRLPNETGGVLIGSFDMQRKIAYIVDMLPSPPDSKEWPTVYIRGCQGLTQRMKEIEEATLGRLEYVGEWHSHPGNSCSPSGDDKKAFALLTDMRRADGVPAIMIIAGDCGNYAIYIGAMS